jgi:hypothetical protein
MRLRGPLETEALTPSPQDTPECSLQSAWNVLWPVQHVRQRSCLPLRRFVKPLVPRASLGC